MYEQSAKAANSIDLETYLKERMLESYKEIYDNNGNIHFVKQEDFANYIQDGMTLMNWIKSKRSKYFSLKGVELKGIEIPVKGLITEESPNIFMIGSIDLIFYDKRDKTYTIYDIKTSTRGWSEMDKRDQTKINQILLYKHYYSQLIKVPLDKINVKFFIVKRRPYENPDFPTHRVQEFIPANGNKKVEKAVSHFKEFINSCYNSSGDLLDRSYEKNLSACRYCPFNNKPELCNRSQE
jgi:hypothetical protein